MEQFSVIRTPVYGKYGGRTPAVNYNDRYSYPISYSEPIYDLDLMIPGMGVPHRPFVPVEYVRNRRKIHPKPLTEEDMIQIQIRADQRTRDILKDFRPSQKQVYESARDFIETRQIEDTIDDIRETCSNIRNLFKKTDTYDKTRRQVFSPRSRSRISDPVRRTEDLVLSSQLAHIDDMSSKMSEDVNNHKSKFEIASAGCRRDSSVQAKSENGDSRQSSVTGSRFSEKPAKKQQSARRASTEARAEALQKLQQRLDEQGTESDNFERTHGKYLTKLRSEVNNLSHITEGFIDDSKTRSYSLCKTLRVQDF